MVNGAPPSPTWVAAVHASAEDFTPLGTAVVVDDRRVLTSAHVVKPGKQVREQLWVAFPRSEDPVPEDPSVSRRRAIAVRVAGHPMADLAGLELADPVPDGVSAARLRCPKPADVVGLP